MDRRQLLKSLALFAGASTTKVSFASSPKTSPVIPVNFKAMFAEALKSNPKLIGYKGVESNMACDQLTLEGSWPADLTGRFYRNGPARLERGEIRYQHLFEGDGMIQAFDIGQNKVSHVGKFVDTPKFKQEQSAQAFLYSGPDTRLNNSRAITRTDDVNVANTSILPVGSDLWALWEAGSATKINKETFAYEKLVNLGQGTASESSLKGLPFSAHPKVMANGEIWNFGYSTSGHIVIYHLNKKGKLERFKVIKTDYVGGMKHDFLVTENHVLLILPSVTTKGSGHDGVFSRLSFDKSRPMTVLVVDKNSLEVTKRYDLAPGFAFHFGNAFEDKQGNIHFDGALHPNLDILFKLSDLMAGKIAEEEVNAVPAFITLYKDGSTKTETIDVATEFPRVSAHVTGLRNRHLYFVSSGKSAVWHDTVCQFDRDSGQVKKFRYGADFIVEEHVPISPNNDEKYTYLIGTALHVPSQRTCLNVFNANALQDGPICRAWLPYHLPLGFHGEFVAS